MEKNKNVPKDEVLLIYSIIDFLLEHGTRHVSFEPDGRDEMVSFIITNQHLNLSLIYNVNEIYTDLIAIDESDNQYPYLLNGENYRKNRPEEIIEVAKKLGVVNV